LLLPGSALEGGAVFEREGQAAIRVGRGVVQQLLPGEGEGERVMGYPDDLKLCSSMTLFEHVAEKDSVFGKVLDKYYGGKRDAATLRML